MPIFGKPAPVPPPRQVSCPVCQRQEFYDATPDGSARFAYTAQILNGAPDRQPVGWCVACAHCNTAYVISGLEHTGRFLPRSSQPRNPVAQTTAPGGRPPGAEMLDEAAGFGREP
jgi:hypothetical protein